MKINIKRKKNDKQKLKIKINNEDVYNLDITAALILLPMFKRLKKIKKSAAWISDEDVPDELKSTAVSTISEYEVDENFERRYDWVLSEVIWALTRVSLEETILFDEESDRTDVGLRLMGKYWRTFWY